MANNKIGRLLAACQRIQKLGVLQAGADRNSEGVGGGCGCKFQVEFVLRNLPTKKPTNRRRGRPAVGSLVRLALKLAEDRSCDQWFGSAGVRGMAEPLAPGGVGW